MATEDHDIDEVRHVSWFQDGELKRFELPVRVFCRPGWASGGENYP